MFVNTFHFLIVSFTFCMAEEIMDYDGDLGKRRDFYSERLQDVDQIDSKLRQMGVLNTWGISYFLTEPPQTECKVTFWNGKVLRTGYIMRVEDVLKPPTVTWPTQENHYYTLYLSDLDGKITLRKNHPNYTIFQAKCNWLVGNIPGCDVAKGTQLFPYSPPAKGQPKEFHRYLVLVYDQHHNEPFDFEGGFISGDEERQDFRVDKFAEFYNFKRPFAGNMYLILDDDDYID